MRGYFELEPQSVLLKSGEEYTLTWELFWQKGNEDFFRKLGEYESRIQISAPPVLSECSLPQDGSQRGMGRHRQRIHHW